MRRKRRFEQTAFIGYSKMLVLVISMVVLLGAGLVACDDSEDDPTATESTQSSAMFKTIADGSFFLEITSPEQPEVIVDTDSVTVAGTTTADAAVSVNDEFVEVDTEGNFESTVYLEDGINLIEVVASVASEDQLDQIITVIYTE